MRPPGEMRRSGRDPNSTTSSGMDSRVIAFFDSGIGGLPYLRWAKERLPKESFVYLADNANFPYGEKSSDEVRDIVVEVIGRLIQRFDPKTVVVACNTATVIALEALRERFSIPFIGVVPALKPAAAGPAVPGSPYRRIGLIGTSRTVADHYVERLIHTFASECTVVRIAARELIAFVETELVEGETLPECQVVRDTMAAVKDHHLDSLVLGCTQLTFLDQVFHKAFGDEVAIIDSRDGVGRQLIRILTEKGIESPEKTIDRFFHTGSVDARYLRFAEHFGLEYGGTLG